MAKGKRQRTNNINCLSFSRFSFGHYIICPFVAYLLPLYCLFFCRFPLFIILFVVLSFSFDHYTVFPFVVYLWPLYCLLICRFPDKRTTNIMAKGIWQKDKQYNGQRKLTNDKQYNGQRKTTKEQTFDHYTVFPFVVYLWPLYCLLICRFPLGIILFVNFSFSFGHYIVCPFVVFLWNDNTTNNIMAKWKTTKGQKI
jgi:hypothetical protein